MRSFSLRNGIQVRHHHMPNNPSFALYLGIRSGAGHEPDSALGISHLLEHILFTTTKYWTTQDLIRTMEWNGIDTNASTNFGHVQVHLHGPLEHFRKALQLLFEMTVADTYTESEFEKEKSIVVEELRSYRNQPSDFLTIWGMEPRLLFGTPMARNILGTEKTLHSITLNDIISHKISSYIADNFVISVCGGTREEEVYDLLESTFGNISSQSKNIPSTLWKPTPQYGEIVIPRKGIDQSYVHRGYLVTSFQEHEFAQMLLLSYILDGGMSSRVFQELREKRGLGYSSGFHYERAYGYCYFYLDGCQPDREKEVAEAFDTIITSLSLIGEDELTGMKTLLMTHLRQKTIREDSIAQNHLHAMLYNSPWVYDALLEKIQSVSISDIVTLARSLFTDRYVHTILRPE